jgi:hypothetical protein
MWIRSQDKKGLYPIGAGGFYPFQNNDDGRELCVSNVINSDDGYFPIGEYATKERAIEVLDEMELQLTNCISYGDEIARHRTICRDVVFQMPEK